MFCKNCGTQIVDNAAFCSACGAAVSSDISESALNSPWKSAGDLEPGRMTSERNTPPRQTQTYGTTPTPRPASAAMYQAALPTKNVPVKQKSYKWVFIIVIIVATLAISATILYSTAKKCDNCGKLFWGEGHTIFGYNLCDDCWR